MNIWKYDELAKKFAHGLVSEKTKYLYFIVPLIITFVLYIISTILLLQLNQEELLSLTIAKCSQSLTNETILNAFALLLAIPFIHYLYTYNKNKCGNIDFIPRFISFAFIAMIRMISTFIISLVFVGIIISLIRNAKTPEQQGMLEISIYVILLLLLITFVYVIIDGFRKIHKEMNPKADNKNKKEFVAKTSNKKVVATKKISNKGEKGKKLVAKNKKGK